MISHKPITQNVRYRVSMRKRHSWPAETGFTLLELLAVVVIIGIVITIASLSIEQKSSHVVQDEVQRINRLLQLAGEEAVLQGRELAIEFRADSYTFLELGADNQWLPVGEDQILHERSLPPDVKMNLVVEGAEVGFEDKNNLPRIFVLSSGELTPFTLTMRLEGDLPYVLQGTIDGKLTLGRSLENNFDTQT